MVVRLWLVRSMAESASVFLCLGVAWPPRRRLFTTLVHLAVPGTVKPSTVSDVRLRLLRQRRFSLQLCWRRRETAQFCGRSAGLSGCSRPRRRLKRCKEHAWV